jgi:hypothetical protein
MLLATIRAAAVHPAPFKPAQRCSSRSKVVVRAKDGSEPAVSEDVIARLRAAEEEAARLKKELAAAQQAAATVSNCCRTAHS